MNLYALSGFLTFVTSLGFGIFSALKGNKRLNKIWAVFCFCVAVWGWGAFKFPSTLDHGTVFFWLRFGHIGVILMPAFFLHFIFEFLETRRTKILIFSYAAALVFLVINVSDWLGFSGLLINQLRFVFNSFYVDSPPAPLYPAFLIYFFGTITYAHYFVLRQYKSSSQLKRQQMKYFLAATVLGFCGGWTSFFMVFGIDIYPTLHITVPLYPVIMTYAIVKHRLMDIEVIIKKTLVFAGLSSFVVACFSIPLFLLPRFFAASLTEELQLWLLMAAGMIVAGLVGPLNQILIRVTDKFLFQKKQEIKVILKNLSEKVSTILDLKQIGQTILSTLKEAFRLELGMIFIRDKRTGKYHLLEYFGLQPEEFAASVKKYFEEPDISGYFLSHQTTLTLDHPDSSGLPAGVKNWLGMAKARVCVPLVIDEGSSGVLVLGRKKSDQEFSQEEIDFFPTIESQVSLAIRNARLIETVVQEREAKVKAEHLAKRVKFSGLIKHEIRNKLTYIQGPANEIAKYFIPRLKRLFKEQNEEEFLESCDKIQESVTKIDITVKRILIIAQTAQGGVDEKDKSVQELDCRVIWEDAKEESGLREVCDFESKMPEGFTVCVNYHALQRVFVNLITNAYDAMKGRDEPLIKLRCSYENIEGKQVAYFEFEDSGCGIPKEIQGKIFEDGFSTKPKPDAKDLISSGHGQGLAACKLYIESIHEGRIWVESEAGRGTTFKFWVPMKGSDGNDHG